MEDEEAETETGMLLDQGELRGVAADIRAERPVTESYWIPKSNSQGARTN